LSKVRILFLGTPEFAVCSLQRLIDDEHFEIAAVLTQPDRPAGRNMKLTPSPVKLLAQRHGLQVFSPESVNSESFCAEILKLKAESAAVVAFGQILKQNFLDLFPLGCVNVHASVLPRLRGAAPIQRAIINDDRESGVSLQIIVKKLDAGDVLGLRRQPITDDMNASDLHDQLKTLGADLLHVEYMDYLRGNIMGHSQNESEVSFAPKIAKAEAHIDWRKSAREIFCLVRGLTMGPIAYTQRDGKNLKIHKVQIRPEKHGRSPGEIIDIGGDSFTVACGSESIEVLELQPESKAKMRASEYLRGYPIKARELLQ